MNVLFEWNVHSISTCYPNRPDKPVITICQCMVIYSFCCISGSSFVKQMKVPQFPCCICKISHQTYVTVSLTNWFLKLVTESSCSEWSGQAYKGAVFASISKYGNSSKSNFHSVMFDIWSHACPYSLDVQYHNSWFYSKGEVFLVTCHEDTEGN